MRVVGLTAEPPPVLAHVCTGKGVDVKCISHVGRHRSLEMRGEWNGRGMLRYSGVEHLPVAGRDESMNLRRVGTTRLTVRRST
jgi:hypothetical protein